ncbi:hypothetical protein [Chryseobacterium gossypii]|uniref:hypothetical protein n=1 Tax=Chryseobacterium gossypii TaxID=3231602 RepID=UPI00352513E2
MKKSLISRLLFLATLLVILYSCRNDLLPDQQETHNNSSQFKLTSKRVSLNQSKHKIKLTAELQQAENLLKKLNVSFNGKTVNYDNFVLDTNDIVYMENGPNYHTYTFRIIRDSAPENAPIENLVFTPLTDGTYRKLLISYNLSPQEKKMLLYGGHVNTKGKTTVTPLGIGAINDILGKTSQSCGYVTADAYTWCSEGVHHNGEQGSCTADVKSQLITVFLYVCTSYDDGSGGGGGSGPGGGYGPGGDGSGGDGTWDGDWICPDPQIPTGPQSPNTDIGDGSCYGIPTNPNVGTPPTPCEKLSPLLDPTKANLKPLIVNGMYSYINSSIGEAGIFLKRDSGGHITTQIAAPTGDNTLKVKVNDNYFSAVHTHPKTTYPMFSYDDILSLYSLEIYGAVHNTGQSSFILVCEDDFGVKQTYALVFENTGKMVEEIWNSPENIGCSIEELKKVMEDKYIEFYEGEEEGAKNYERAFLRLNFGTNIGLYKANEDLTGWSKLSIDSDSPNAIVKPANCN